MMKLTIVCPKCKKWNEKNFLVITHYCSIFKCKLCKMEFKLDENDKIIPDSVKGFSYKEYKDYVEKLILQKFHQKLNRSL